jgi:hypothetical protein
MRSVTACHSAQSGLLIPIVLFTREIDELRLAPVEVPVGSSQ